MQRSGQSGKSDKRFCPWCEAIYHPELNSDCRAELLQEPKEVLVDLLGHIAGVNAIAMALLQDSPDLLEELGFYNTPQMEGVSRRRLTMQELARKRQRVQ